MIYPTIRTIFDRRKIATREICSTVYVEVLHKRVRKLYNTGVKVYAGEWSASKMVINRADSFFLNQHISTLLNKIQNFISRCIQNNKAFDFEDLSRYLSYDESTNSFLTFMETRMMERKLRPNTLKNHRSSLNILKEFNGIKTFDDLTAENVRKYDRWLHERYTRQTSVYFHHKELKAYINEAIRAGLITNNPYNLVRISHGRSDARRYLEDWELEKIKSAKMPNPSLSKVRDLFVFQCYTGLAYVDLSKFDFSKVIERRGKYILRDVRQKSDEDYYIVLLTPAVEILKKYDYKLPIITNQQYNLRLKAVADHSGLDKNLTSHMARHTFAGICINNGINIEILAQMMGHTDIKTTQIYAKIFNKTVESAFDELERKLL